MVIDSNSKVIRFISWMKFGRPTDTCELIRRTIAAGLKFLGICCGTLIGIGVLVVPTLLYIPYMIMYLTSDIPFTVWNDDFIFIFGTSCWILVCVCVCGIATDYIREKRRERKSTEVASEKPQKREPSPLWQAIKAKHDKICVPIEYK